MTISVEKNLTSLAVKEIQTKVALKFHFTPVTLAVIKIANDNKIAGRQNLGWSSDGNGKQQSHCGDHSGPS